MDAEPKPFPEWSKKKKVKYFAALKELLKGTPQYDLIDHSEMRLKRNWKAKDASK